jgi:bifunctional non-homologous end joining protein LigD
MSLSDYHHKRHFQQTPEPKGKFNTFRQKPLEFVIHKHHASHLHYDFRLELDGVLKSWAVPKGPPLFSTDKRLAVQVEDHPFDYRTFEGTIPEGNYGAGQVLIWDKGVYQADQALSRQENEDLIRKGLEEGHLHFTLKGQKLKGNYVLLRFKDQPKNWLLLKSRTEEETEKTKSSSKKTKNEVSATKKTPPKKRKNLSQIKKNLVFSHLDKVYWPQEGYTKGELIAYYQQVAPLIIPYLKNRPLTMRRYPNGIEEPSFYQKNVENIPDWIHVEKVQHETSLVNYLIVDDEPSLLYIANLGCIDLHPFHSRTKSLNFPDYMVFDLDPVDLPFDQVVEVAQATHQLLDELNLPSVCKTSGSKGLHIYVPLKARYSYEVVGQVSQWIAQLICQKIPDLTSLERNPQKRQHKVYIDYLRNHFGQTVVAPYAVRPLIGAAVSTPLEWNEVEKGLDPQQFTLKSLPRRLQKKGDLFHMILEKGARLTKLIKQLKTI